MSLKDRILAGLASIRGQQLTAEEKAELDRVEAVAKGEALPVATLPVPTATATANPAPVAVIDPKISTQIEEQGKQIAALTGLLTTMTTTLTAQQTQARLSSNLNAINGLVASFRMTPAQAEDYRKLAQENPSAFEATLPMLQQAPIVKQRQRDSVKTVPTQGGSAGEQLVSLANARVKATGELYQNAFIAVVRENPTLAAEHQQNRPVLGAPSQLA